MKDMEYVITTAAMINITTTFAKSELSFFFFSFIFPSCPFLYVSIFLSVCVYMDKKGFKSSVDFMISMSQLFLKYEAILSVKIFSLP